MLYLSRAFPLENLIIICFFFKVKIHDKLQNKKIIIMQKTYQELFYPFGINLKFLIMFKESKRPKFSSDSHKLKQNIHLSD
jgi:hypothetical protein